MQDTDPTGFELSDFIPYLLNQASETQSTLFSKVYREKYGMLRTEWRVLYHLGRHGPLSAKQIATRAQIHKTKISRAVAALEAKRFVSRETSETDRRVEMLVLRPPGLAAFHDIARAALAYEQRLGAMIGPQDMKRLRDLLRDLSQ